MSKDEAVKFLFSIYKKIDTYYQKNKERLEELARNRNHQQGEKKAKEHCQNNKERFQKQAQNIAYSINDEYKKAKI